jgi:hypothetical protein
MDEVESWEHQPGRPVTRWWQSVAPGRPFSKGRQSMSPDFHLQLWLRGQSLTRTGCSLPSIISSKLLKVFFAAAVTCKHRVRNLELETLDLQRNSAVSKPKGGSYKADDTMGCNEVGHSKMTFTSLA